MKIYGFSSIGICLLLYTNYGLPAINFVNIFVMCILYDDMMILTKFYSTRQKSKDNLFYFCIIYNTAYTKHTLNIYVFIQRIVIASIASTDLPLGTFHFWERSDRSN